jgi:bifunctional non-homologous end joining protein LigD
MLLDERRRAPEDQSRFIAELKHDGWRVMAGFGQGHCQLFTKQGNDCTRRFQEVSDALAALNCGQTITDGEMVVLDDLGRSDFDALQRRAQHGRRKAGDPTVIYCIFDLLVHRGKDITALPLTARKARLAELLAVQKVPFTLYVQHISTDDVVQPVSWLYDWALKAGLEGVVGKLADSPYLPGERSANWFKLKVKGAVPPHRFKRSVNSI